MDPLVKKFFSRPVNVDRPTALLKQGVPTHQQIPVQSIGSIKFSHASIQYV